MHKFRKTIGKISTIIANPSKNVPKNIKIANINAISTIGCNASSYNSFANDNGICVRAKNGENTLAPIIIKYIITVVDNVLSKASIKAPIVNSLRGREKIKARIAPTDAASTGVNTPP